MTQHQPHRPHPRRHRDARTRWSLPLVDHPMLMLNTDMARVSIVPVVAGESPWLEVVGDHHHEAPPVEVDASSGTTRVHVSGPWHGDPTWWNGPWWDAAFWEKRFWRKAFRVSVVAHVPSDVRGELKSNAARMHVERLASCDLKIETDAGSLLIDDVSGRLRLSTQAGRIEAHRISGAIDIATSAGAVYADVLSLSPGTHRVRTNVGSVRLDLARGMPVRIAARTTMGATRIDFPTSDDAPALIDIEADLGAIRVSSSSHDYVPDTLGGGPYRSTHVTPPPPRNDEEIERILARVADGSITPEAARDLLRELGVT